MIENFLCRLLSPVRRSVAATILRTVLGHCHPFSNVSDANAGATERLSDIIAGSFISDF
jgi:hypothetical protein